mgnify:CR=1 FL=1
MTSSILLVDDEINNRNAVRRQFEDYDIDFLEASNGQDALDLLKQHDIDLILLDIKMPIMDGFTFLETFSDSKERAKPLICVMTGFNDSTTRRKAIYLGADDFINKPIDPIELETRIASLLRIRHQQHDLKILNQSLEERVEQRSKQLLTTLEQLKESKKQNTQAYREMITRICGLMQINTTVSRLNPRKLGYCTTVLGKLHGLPEEQLENLSLSSQLYNIGMLALPEKLRESSRDQLNKDELTVLSTHAKLGSDLFRDSDIPLLQQTYNICRYCHERYDGTGLPNGVKSENIPIEARLFAAAHVIMETLIDIPGADSAQVRTILQDHAGTLLDPLIVETILGSKDSLHTIINELR